MARKMALIPKEPVSEYYQLNKPEIRVEDNISNLLHDEEKSADVKAKLLSHWIPKYQRLMQPPPPPKPFEIPKELLQETVKTMTYLAKARKDDLKTLATELGLEIGEMMRAERDEKEENDYKRKQEGLILEPERMKLSMTATSTNTNAAAAEKINIQHLILRFVENSDISTYLKIFERQL
ncbi:uncharacterized protein TNCV_3986271 [Trichonephila clavipes]|nr:uncharacterized protein TNCV_3986271 [Trichonephila clavipes]